MGFVSGAISFRRFYITGQHARSLNEDTLDAIASHAFGKHGSMSSDGIEFGWIAPTHLFDIDFEHTDRVMAGRFVHLAMRVDRTAPPATIVRSYRMMEEAAALDASGREFLTKTERRLAKEAALERAEQEARSGAFRRISAFPVLIDLEDGVAYFGSLGATAADKLMSLFSDTFGAPLVPAHLEEVVYRIASRQKTTQALDNVVPLLLVDAPAGYAREDDEPIGDRLFLGREFLTWLWDRLDRDEGMFTGGAYSILVALCKQLRLDCTFDLTGSDVIHHEVPSSAPEAKAALRIGKLPVRAGMLVETTGADYTFTLSADSLNISALSVPKPEEKDAAAILEHRFDAIRSLSGALDSLLGQFLEVRLGREWEKESTAMKRWVASSSTGSGSGTIRMVSA